LENKGEDYLMRWVGRETLEIRGRVYQRLHYGGWGLLARRFGRGTKFLQGKQKSHGQRLKNLKGGRGLPNSVSPGERKKTFKGEMGERFNVLHVRGEGHSEQLGGGKGKASKGDTKSPEKVYHEKKWEKKSSFLPKKGGSGTMKTGTGGKGGNQDISYFKNHLLWRGKTK